MNLAYNISNGFKIKLIDLSDDTQVNSGGSTNDQTLTPPAGKIYQVIKIWFSVPAPVGDTSGNHRMRAFYESGMEDPSGVFWCDGNHSTVIRTYYGALVGDISEVPSSHADQIDTMSSGDLWVNNDNPLTFEYLNNTDANQTGTRTLKVLVKEYNEMG